jgi:methylmalonyl-CoA mutase cobalamin-binding subunit
MIQVKSKPVKVMPVPLLNQQGVEQTTGLARETLRKWESRYHFPTPTRGARGQRMYSHDDVHRLQLIKQLINLGMRPGKLVPLPVASLQELLADARTVANKAPGGAADSLLHCLAPGAPVHAVRTHLERLIKQEGLAHFVDRHLPAFNLAVGNAWQAGHLGVHAEHHYTETVRHAVKRALPSVNASPELPRVLATTPPGELHGLGVLALQAALTLQGAHCISLGTQTPHHDVVRAVDDLDIQVVAISASECLCPDAMRSYMLALRHTLPQECRLWAGGKGCAPLAQQLPAGIELFQTVGQAALAWRTEAARHIDNWQ